MRPKENYSPMIRTAFGLTLAILVAFQVYIFREPDRIAADGAREQSATVQEGQFLFSRYCTLCHGKQGEGVKAPALNDKHFLAETSNEVIFSVASSGVPNTEMPAWNQAHGGPLTDQQLQQIVAFIRSWEPTAPDRHAQALAGDPANGLAVFKSACAFCHGENGQGTEKISALNDPAKLAQFDSKSYRDAIVNGRPANGMPTWGAVLSTQQVTDVVALIAAWQRGEIVAPPSP